MTNSTAEDNNRPSKRLKICHFFQMQATAFVLLVAVVFLSATILADATTLRSGNRLGVPTTKRTRKSYAELLEEIGPGKFRRMYRMHEQSFLDLFHLIEPYMKVAKTRSRGATPNGGISNEQRLMMALRFFAGGDKYDIATVHSVHEHEVYRSVWRVVDAIHQCEALKIRFPQSHQDQAQVAAEFQRHSSADFANCVGCIDGMLVWTCKPSETTEVMGVGSGKFFCGRKKKFGVQIQAVCDYKRRFLDVSCGHPGSASDFTMWLDCALREDLEREGFLAPGLVLFGDNAYVNTPNMVCPFKSVSAGPRDAFNFYHSQTRINIECAFGVLVHRWGCLRKPMPMNFQVKKINILFLALCMLHNFCINAHHNNEVTATSQEDAFNIAIQGGIQLPRIDRGVNGWSYDAELDRLNSFLDGGDIHEPELNPLRRNDVSRTDSSRIEYDAAVVSVTDLPIYSMLNHIEQEGYVRPGPTGSTTTNSRFN